jgi:hypothetical protein
MKPLIPQTVYIPTNNRTDFLIIDPKFGTSNARVKTAYLFTKEELTNLIADTWDASANCIEDIMKHDKAVNYPNLPQFINNLLNQQ